MKRKWRWLKMPIVVWKDISNAVKISLAHLKAVWWLRFLLITFIIIVVFALWIQFSRAFVKPPDNFADWIYQFLDDWSVPLSASVMLLLATAAFFSILDNRHARAIDRMERLLNEIIEWATDVTKYTTGQTALGAKETIEVISSGIPLEVIKKTVSGERFVELNGLSSKGVYIKSLAPRLFPDNIDLHRAIHNVRLRIFKHLRFLDLARKGRVKNDEKASQIHLRRLQDDACTLVELAVSIYTQIK